jgi:hypothetical protein
MKDNGTFSYYRDVEVKDGNTEQELIIDWAYFSSPAVMYTRSGDPGSDAEEDIEFTARLLNGTDVTDTLSEKEMEDIDEDIRSRAGKGDYGSDDFE